MSRIQLPPFRAAPLLLTLAAAFAHAVDPKPPVHIEADQVSGQTESGASAQGNVVVTQGDLRVESEWGNYDAPNDRLTGGDHVTMTRPGSVLHGRTLDYYIQRHEGTLTDPDYAMSPGKMRGDGAELLFEGEDKYRIDSGRATSCRPGDDSWYLHASTMWLDYTSNSGVAHNGWIEFKGVPILYSPWMNFPLDNGRQTGFLTPSLSFDNRNGFDLTLPFYWNIAPNYDATISTRYLARRGLMMGGEFRYLQPGYTGVLQVQGMNDREDQATRYSVLFQHQQTFTDRLWMAVDVQKVSDDSFFNDFGERAAIASQTNLPRQVLFGYNGDNWNSNLLFQRYQTIQQTSIPYARMPQLTFNANPQWLDGVRTGVSGEITDFTHPSLTNGVRSWVYPTISMPFVSNYSFFTPKIGVHASNYQLRDASGGNSRNESRVLPVVSLDSGLFFERDLDVGGNALTQTLEPRAYYVYIPYKKQSDLPNFDSAVTDLSFAQLFRENQYSGNDRINDANQLTLALSSRIYTANDGIELLQASIGQRFYFKDQQVTLSSNDQPSSASKSDLLLSLGGRFWHDLSADYTLQYNTEDRKTVRSTAGLTWNPQPGSIFNLRYTINRNQSPSTEQIDVSAQWPLTRNWYGVARVNYSLPDKQPLDAIVGLEYNAGCWGVRLAAQRFITSDAQFKTTYFVVLELDGLGGIGSNPVNALRTAIPGYTADFDGRQQ
ncbi:LPS-assembly protein [Andreprevotia lacus DSM 23236]|jgi:LPS-assembly protein|uniref:LPS-assembly protein LptD n=1 Tax=Andreprevotia lacus DSM 23236 TaxID=1121001 RepID=A0A1W1Y024_9NEIS|nr:LPS-assembly protein LptD [Andreprevotia lacus]SMC29569.1 LPS-assembly protein [Andreprevotia lacus DSM 23236]